MDKQKHYAIYGLDPHQNMGMRRWTWGNKEAKKMGGRQTERKETDGLQTRTFEIQLDIHNDSKWAKLSPGTP